MRAASLLIVEDDDLDAEALERALRKEHVITPRFRAENGEDALRMLRGEPGFAAPPSPSLILLDLNMPRMNGLEFLEALRSDPNPDLRRTVTFVLTTSDDPSERAAAYDHGIAGFVVKSRAGLDFRKLTQLVSDYERVVVFP
ncbi:MAG: response regulator [Myxococcota bacterium]